MQISRLGAVAAIAVSGLFACGTSEPGASRSSASQDPRPELDDTATEPVEMTVEFADGSEEFTFTSLAELEERSVMVAEGQVTGFRYLDPVVVDTQRWEPRLVEIEIGSVLSGAHDGGTVEVHDANRVTKSDGTTKLVVFVDDELLVGDRIVAALIPASTGEGTFTINSSSAFFRLTADGTALVAFGRSNPVAEAAQELSPAELRAALSE